jgi:outer membrane protein assembly factor BamE (lipoprotein component of BamABCDE complex)
MASLFHADRWDYVFTLKRQGVEPQSYKYTVFFKNDQLERFEGDAMPSEAEFIAKLGSRRKLGEVPVLEATEAQLNKAAEKPSLPRPRPQRRQARRRHAGHRLPAPRKPETVSGAATAPPGPAATGSRWRAPAAAWARC